MRVTRTILLICAVAFAAAGCAYQPRVPYAATPASQGIDNVVYGATAPAAAPVAPGPAAPGYRGFVGSGPLYATESSPIQPTRVAMAAPPPMSPPIPAAMTGPAPFAAPAIVAPAMAPPGLSAPFQQGGYTLDSGDRLRVVVFGQDGLTNSYVVDASGHIDMPLIGTVAARGLTTSQLSGRIADQLRQGFIREPHVAVEVEAYRPFFILGEVTQPGQYPYVANMTVETAVAIAGGFGPRGYHKTMIISRNFAGGTYRFEVPITYPLCPGDTVQVQERWF
jgi:Polysaccharide biosynthesis/export protein/SLBB domain